MFRSQKDAAGDDADLGLQSKQTPAELEPDHPIETTAYGNEPDLERQPPENDADQGLRLKPTDNDMPDSPALSPGLSFSRSDSYHREDGRHETRLFPYLPDAQARDTARGQHGIPPLSPDPR
jgi:hypothetical protein